MGLGDVGQIEPEGWLQTDIQRRSQLPHCVLVEYWYPDCEACVVLDACMTHVLLP